MPKEVFKADIISQDRKMLKGFVELTPVGRADLLNNRTPRAELQNRFSEISFDFKVHPQMPKNIVIPVHDVLLHYPFTVMEVEDPDE